MMPEEYKSIVVLMREIQQTAGAIANFLETRTAIAPVNEQFIKTRVQHIKNRIDSL